MPTRTAFIDVDLTLVDIDDNLLPGVPERLQEMKVRGYELVCWSHGGKEYAQRTLEKHGINKFFSAILDKPDWIIDDSPEGINKWADTLKVKDQNFWDKQTFWNTLFHKEVF